MAIPFCCCRTGSFPGAVLDLCQYTKADSTVSLHLWDWIVFLTAGLKFCFVLEAGIAAAVLVAAGWQLAAGRMLFPCLEFFTQCTSFICVMLGFTFISSWGEDSFPSATFVQYVDLCITDYWSECLRQLWITKKSSTKYTGGEVCRKWH